MHMHAYVCSRRSYVPAIAGRRGSPHPYRCVVLPAGLAAPSGWATRAALHAYALQMQMPPSGAGAAAGFGIVAPAAPQASLATGRLLCMRAAGPDPSDCLPSCLCASLPALAVARAPQGPTRSTACPAPPRWPSTSPRGTRAPRAASCCAAALAAATRALWCTAARTGRWLGFQGFGGLGLQGAWSMASRFQGLGLMHGGGSSFVVHGGEGGHVGF